MRILVLQRVQGRSTLAVTVRHAHMGDGGILETYIKHSPAVRIRALALL